MTILKNNWQLLLVQFFEISSNDNLLTTIIYDLFEKYNQIDPSFYKLLKYTKFENLAKYS